MTMCPICDNHAVSIILTLDDSKREKLELYDERYYGGALSRIFKDDEYEVAFCSRCHHVFYKSMPSPQNLALMYQAHARAKNLRKLKPISEDQVFPANAVRLLRFLYRHRPSGLKLLDYGAGQGLWSRIAANQGFDVISFEPHSERVDAAIRHVHDWKEVVEKAPFDIILCNQVLEHVPDPLLTLREISAVSKQDTVLLTTVPNARKLGMNKLVSSWPFDGRSSHVIAPFQHLHGFSQRSFLDLHKKAGFQVDYKTMVFCGVWGLRSLLAPLLGKASGYLSRTGFLFVPEN